MRYTCYCCGRTNMATATRHIHILCDPCYYDLRSSDIRSARNQEQYLELRHAGKSDDQARRAIGPLDTYVG